MTCASASSASASSARPPSRKAVGGLVAALALAAQHRELVAVALLGRLLQLGEHEPQRAETRSFSPAFIATVRSCLTLSANSTASMIRPSAGSSRATESCGPGSHADPGPELAP